MNAGSEHDISICADSQMALKALRAAKNSVAIGMAVAKGAECYIQPPLCGTLLCINIYNKLSDGLACLITKKKPFLQELKKHLSTMPYYSLEEFLNTEQI
jgi:hypothetical protein